MRESLPIVFVPGLRCSARLYAPQILPLWQLGPVLIADHTKGNTIAEIAGGILKAAPSRFALVGLRWAAISLRDAAPGNGPDR